MCFCLAFFLTAGSSPPTHVGGRVVVLPAPGSRHVLVTPKRFDFQGSRFCLLLCQGKVPSNLAVGFAQQERARLRWHSWTRRSPRRPPIKTKPNVHHHGLMRGPRRHRSRERTRTGSIDTTIRQTRIEAQLHRKRMKHRETKKTRVSWQMAVHAHQ